MPRMAALITTSSLQKSMTGQWSACQLLDRHRFSLTSSVGGNLNRLFLCATQENV